MANNKLQDANKKREYSIHWYFSDSGTTMTPEELEIERDNKKKGEYSMTPEELERAKKAHAKIDALIEEGKIVNVAHGNQTASTAEDESVKEMVWRQLFKTNWKNAEKSELIDKLTDIKADIKIELYKFSEQQKEFQKQIERVSHNLGMHILEHDPEIEVDKLFNIFGRESIFETLDRLEDRLRKLENAEE